METSQNNSNGSIKKVLKWVEEIQNNNLSVFPLLSAQYLPLIHKLLNQFYLDHYERQDLYQESLLALYKAAQTYSPTKGASFSTYATSCIRHRLIDLLRQKEPSAIVTDTLEGIAGEHSLSLLSSSYEEELQELLKKTKDILSHYEHQVLLLYLSGFSYKEIAQNLNITEKSVDNALQRGRGKLRQFRPQEL